MTSNHPVTNINSTIENIRIIDPQTDHTWDEFVEQHPNGWICHLSGWKTLIEASFSHIKGYYIVKYDPMDGTICAGLPIYFVKSFLTGKRLVSAPFATLFDPLYRNETDLTALAEAAILMCDNLKSSFIEIRSFNTDGLKADNRFKAECFYKHHYISLSEEPDVLKKGFHRTCVRQRINRALESDIRLEISESDQGMKDFYSVYLITRKRTSLPPMPYRFFKSLWDIFYPSGKISVLLAHKQNKTLAGMILFKYKNRVSAEFAASDEHYKHISPNHFLFWQAINLAYDEGYSIFDFGRTSLNNQSLLDFKNHWATSTFDLANYMYTGNSSNGQTAADKKLGYKLMRKINQFLPQRAYPKFGEFCYRHLG